MVPPVEKVENIIKATPNTVKLATNVNPFLNDINLSLLYELNVNELTIDIVDI